MKSSWEMLRSFHRSWYLATTRSASSMGLDPLGRRRLLDLLTVLVGAGQKIDLLAPEPLIAGEGVGHHRRVDVADVGHVVDIVDRCGDVKGVGHGASRGQRIAPRPAPFVRTGDGRMWRMKARSWWWWPYQAVEIPGGGSGGGGDDPGRIRRDRRAHPLRQSEHPEPGDRRQLGADRGPGHPHAGEGESDGRTSIPTSPTSWSPITRAISTSSSSTACLGIDFRWVMKQELRSVPGLGAACAALGHIYIDRSNHEAAVRSINDARERITGGTSVIFFPEGTRSDDGRLKRFKKGAFRFAIDTGLARSCR